MANLSELSDLFTRIDTTDLFTGRVSALTEWLESIPSVDEARLVCAEQLRLGAENHSVHRIATEKADLLPGEQAILNGKSPIPKGVFHRPGLSPVTVYSPFLDHTGTVVGAILVKSSSPKQFLKTNRSLLGLLTSKARDVVEIASLRSRDTGAGDGGVADDLTPRVIAKLMDLLNLPMYVMSSDGTFTHVNERFLRNLNFLDLDDVNSRDGIFLRRDDWGADLRRLTADDGFTPLTVTVRSGDDKVRTVQDYSMLIGRNVLGVLLDVSDYVSVNERLKETLERQQSLNERLSATTGLLQKTQATAMKSLAKLAEYRDKETGGHLQRICEYMRIMTREVHKDQPYNFHVSDEYPEDIYLSGMLHDIGKVGVPDQILLKPGPLDEPEWTVMKKHTSWGYAILNQADQELGEQSFLTLASRIALHHHEWWDGNGYPGGLVGEEIPLSARIGTVADVYDALTSRRPYKDAWSHDRAVEEIIRLTGKQFDPVVGEIFTRVERTFEEVREKFPDEPVLTN